MIQASHPIPEVLHRQTKRLQDRFLDGCRTRALDLPTQKFGIVKAAWAASPFVAELAVGDPRWFIDEILSVEVLPRPHQYYFENHATLFS